MKKPLNIPYGKELLRGVLAANLLLLFGQAHAFDDPVTFLPTDAPIQFKYNNLEILVDEVDQTLTGIVAISSIGDPSGADIYWAAGLSGSQLNGVFTDLNVAQIQPSGAEQEIFFIDGILNLYSVDIGSYSPTGPADPIDPQICGGACPSPWLTLDFVPGIIAIDDAGTVFDETTTTLFSTVSALSSPFTGTGDGNLSATGGSAASFFESDFSLQSNLQTCPAPGTPFQPNCDTAGDWPVASFDPVIGVSVPEPGLVGLMSAGLLGMWVTSRRRRKTKNT